MKKILLISLFIILIILKLISAVPEIPMIITGNATINENPAKIGSSITAELGDKEISKTKTTETGKFTILLQKLNEGDSLKLYVNGIYAENISYKSGDFKQLNLKVKKTYLFYYIGAIIAFAIIFITWKIKQKKHH